MANTLKLSEQGFELVEAARKRKGWNAQEDKWFLEAKVGPGTLKRFRARQPVRRENFISFCKAVGIENWEDVAENPQLAVGDIRPDFFAYHKAWVGRDSLVTQLKEKLEDSCRILILLGITGIGKTALGEKLALDLSALFGGDWKNRFRRVNFDHKIGDTPKSEDFVDVAKGWLKSWEYNLNLEDIQPENLLQILLKHLDENIVFIVIDSLEELLTGNENEGWGDFVDKWWGIFFRAVLSRESFSSRIIITSQDLPSKIPHSRYSNFYHCEVIYGLEKPEQEALFKITGFEIDDGSSDLPILMRCELEVLT